MSSEPDIDLGFITGSGVRQALGASEPRRVQTSFGEAKVTVAEAGGRTVGGVSRHGEGHRYLPHGVSHRANLAALWQLGARAVLATSAVGTLDTEIALGRPLLFDDLFFPSNRLPDGSPCTFFAGEDDPERGHLIPSEPFSPRLRSKMALAAKSSGMEAAVGGVYGHVEGPRFNTAAEVRWLRAAGVTAVSQTCGPEAVLAGELQMPYQLAGFPINSAAGAPGSESREDLDRLLALSAQAIPRLLRDTAKLLEEEDFLFDYGYVYRLGEGY